jgi:hypothetical protein
MKFECMFCGLGIEHEEPLQVILVRQSEAGRRDAATSSYWTHLACLRDRMHEPRRGYLAAWEADGYAK